MLSGMLMCMLRKTEMDMDMDMDITMVGIVLETQHYLVAYKPGGIPTVPKDELQCTGETLLEMLSPAYPEISLGVGKRSYEGLVLHRLDTATAGLVLIARDVQTFQALEQSQQEGRFIKRYIAGSFGGIQQEGFPREAPFSFYPPTPVLVESRFRPYGPGRKSVRPVSDQCSSIIKAKTGDRLYATQVLPLGRQESGEYVFSCELTAGFRHQVRCHLAWCSFALTGDTLYGGCTADSLHLVASSIRFIDPIQGKPVEVALPKLPRWAVIGS
jgi:23S rRNA pseudouridine1911/1915/1917 synthase